MTGPDPSIDALLQRANAAFQDGRLDEALDASREVLALQPERADVMAFAGMVALRMGDNGEAARMYHASLAIRPDHPEAFYNLGNALKNLGRPGDAMAAYGRAIDIRPDLAPAHNNIGSVLQSLERYEEAEAAYRRTLELAPNVPEPHRNLGIVLQRLERLEEATECFRSAVALRPDWEVAYTNLATVLLQRGEAGETVAACEAWLAHFPGSVEGMAFKCAALNDAGEEEALGELLDFDRFVHMRRWPAPPGYTGIEAFNAALADFVSSHPTMRVPPEDDPTYHHPNLQITEELLGQRDGPMAQLEAMMVEAVRDYERALPDDPTHPFIANWPRRWRLSSWATLIEGQGNLVPHIHLDGYLGGVYYPAIPAIVDEAAQQPAGWFELGRPPDALPCHSEPVVRAIRPEEGLMLLFPGYFYHRTVPFESNERRISIAFDVVPDP